MKKRGLRAPFKQIERVRGAPPPYSKNQSGHVKIGLSGLLTFYRETQWGYYRKVPSVMLHFVLFWSCQLLLWEFKGCFLLLRRGRELHTTFSLACFQNDYETVTLTRTECLCGHFSPEKKFSPPLPQFPNSPQTPSSPSPPPPPGDPPPGIFQ